jgi:hypothetical protein
VKRRAVVAAVLGFFVVSSAALAQDSSVGGYAGLAGEVAADAGRGQAAAVSGALPFTGIDLLLVAAAGATILIVGFALRQFGRARA